MTFDMIKTFLTLAETQNFNRTAELLFVAQPTVTVRIKALEEEMKLTLFERTHKSVELTTAGLQFLPYATKLYKAMADCQKFSESKEHYKKHLTFSAPVTCWDYGPLRQKILSYCQDHEDTMIRLLRDSSNVTYQKILDNEVDMGVVYSTPANPDMERIPFIRENIYLVASPQLAQLAKGDLLTHPAGNTLPPLIRPAYAAIATQLVEESLYTLPSRITSDHPSLYLDLVKSGLGIGLLQESIIEQEVKEGTLVLVDCPYNEHPLSYQNHLIFFKRKEQMLRPLIEMLL